MTDEQAPKIEFPCAGYPIKVIGNASDDFQEIVLAVAIKYDPSLDHSSVQLIPSSKGNYASVRFLMTATGESQLKAMFEELKATGRVKMVL